MVLEQKFVTKAQLARRYAVTLRTITNWMRARRVSYVKLGRVVRFDPAQADAELRRAGLVQAR